MKRTRSTLVGLSLAFALCGGAFAKLPPPSDEVKTKAAEAAAKSAWGDKIAAYQLCQAQERIAARYFAEMKQAGKEASPALPAPACADPGPYVAAAAQPRPLEAAGAHSPPATAVAPPSSKATEAEISGKAKK